MEKITDRSLRRRKLYRGFSMYNYEQNRTHRIYDVEAVKIDLLNHIYTRKGSRLNMPTFGTSIPDLVMEQMDERTILELEEELRAVVNYDPRVRLTDDNALTVIADPDRNLLIAAIRLFYLELNYVDTLSLNIEFSS